jgi:hypothetical protein
MILFATEKLMILFATEKLMEHRLIGRSRPRPTSGLILVETGDRVSCIPQVDALVGH